MDYKKIDAEAEKAVVLRSLALAAEDAAFQQECDIKEKQALAQEFTDYKGPDSAASERTALARREADSYAKAAGLAAEEVKQVHLDFLARWVALIESNHLGHATTNEVLEQAGLPLRGSDVIMAQLEVSHRVALDLLATEESKK